jgi:hypothetical protein
MRQQLQLTRLFFSVISLGLVFNAFFLQKETTVEVRLLIVVLQGAILFVSLLDWE